MGLDNPFIHRAVGAPVPVPACLWLSDDVFPRVRAHAARRLVADGWTQSRIADTLRVSQAMVSKYVARDDDESDPLVLRLAHEVVVGADASDASGPSGWCTTLSTAAEDQGAIGDLLEAEAELLAAAPVHLVPQVGMNMARALDGATDPSRILAYPARLVAAGNRIVRPVAPEPGASNHLSSVLLAMRSANPGLAAIANVRGDIPCPDAVRVHRGDNTTDVPLLDAARAGAQILHDPGAFGIEPSLYVAGPDARSVVAQILQLRSP